MLGATIVAAHAGEMISEFSVAMKTGAGAKAIAGTIHPYPTQAEVNKKSSISGEKPTSRRGPESS
ncbi:MAG: hypothetical protein MRJ92_02360 [Nitrospira sp.]|nr:hypothetical protein [Nitrospira sp.]